MHQSRGEGANRVIHEPQILRSSDDDNIWPRAEDHCDVVPLFNAKAGAACMIEDVSKMSPHVMYTREDEQSSAICVTCHRAFLAAR